MGLFDLLEKETQEQEKPEEIKEAEVVEEQQADDSKKEEIAESKEETDDVKENSAAKKKSTAKKDDKNAAKKKNTKEGYLYPFQIYSEGHYIDIDSFGFVEGQRYSDKEITEIMRNHKIWEFFGNVTYSFMKEDNVLLANFTQHKKG